MEFIRPELLILIPILYGIGIILKKSRLSDTLIPLILGVISIAISIIWIVVTSDIFIIRDVIYAMIVSTIQGILSAGSSVYLNQLYVQSKKKK